jgi:hypothetical protein
MSAKGVARTSDRSAHQCTALVAAFPEHPPPEYPAPFGAGQVGTDMRTLFTAEHFGCSYGFVRIHSLLLRRTSNLALLLHNYVERYCLVPHQLYLAANGSVKHTWT